MIDRLSADLREAYPDLQGFSPRNLEYMRAFAATWPDVETVQRVVARLPWRQNITLVERLDDTDTRLWYAEQALRHGWSQPILRLQIDDRAHERGGTSGAQAGLKRARQLAHPLALAALRQQRPARVERKVGVRTHGQGHRSDERPWQGAVK